MMQYKDTSVLKKWLCVEWTLQIDSKLLQNVSKYLIYHAKFEVSPTVLLKI